MRFDTPVYFLTETEGTYDASTGDYDDPVTTEQEVYADITNTGTQTLNLMYGNIKESSLTVRTREFFSGQRMRIGGKIYRVDSRRKLKDLTTYIVSEVQ